MTKKLIVVIIFIICTGCSTVADLTIQSVAGVVGGALGNMADRRMEKALGNNAEEEDKKLEKKFIPDKFRSDDDKEEVDEYKNSQIIQRRGTYWGI